MKHILDWVVMGSTLLFIIGYGVWRSRGTKDIKGYLLSNNDQAWWTIGLSIMATQASAITFLSTPGQAYQDGMAFVQFYMGLPIAMILISMIAIPIYRRLNVFTAYEYLEQRFDAKTRTLGAILFMMGRGLGAGITIVAPAIILETIVGWDYSWICVGIGMLVMIYTVSGGTKAVSQTQVQQMAIILVGIVAAGVVMVNKLPGSFSMNDALHLAGSTGRLETITLPDSWKEFVEDRYNILSGLIAGTFLMLSYFGTDQSQVQRYLGGKSIGEIRLGLMFNGMLKIPMQFGILFIGIMLFVYYQVQPGPMFFNEQARTAVLESPGGEAYAALEATYDSLGAKKRLIWQSWSEDRETKDPQESAQMIQSAFQLDTLQQQARTDGISLIQQYVPDANPKDQDRVFLRFVLDHLPIGLVGLLMAVIFSAAMSSTAAELNALASTTVVDIYKRWIRADGSDKLYLRVSRLVTFLWGVFAIFFAIVAGQFDNLIEFVNILGSLFYGTILGLFVVAFFFKKVQGNAVFFAGLIGELTVVACYGLPLLFPDSFEWLQIGYLWLNLIGCVAVMFVSLLIQAIWPASSAPAIESGPPPAP